MLLATAVTIFFTVGLAAAMRRDDESGLIARTPYNNRYSDAPGAREDHLG